MSPLLRAVADAREEFDRARKLYRDAVLAAADAGISNTVIARAAGVTETAIRTFVKRNA